MQDAQLGWAVCQFCWDVPVRAGYRCTRHDHGCTEIVYSLHAEGTLHQRGRQYRYSDGSVFVYQPGCDHWIDNVAPGEHICLGVDGGLARKLPEGTIHTATDLHARFMEMRRTHAERRAFWRERMDLLASLLLFDLLENGASGAGEDVDRIDQVCDYIDDHLDSNLSVAALASLACVSGDYLRQLFRERRNESIKSYIIRKRISRACNQLHSTDTPIRVIAASVGIENEFYFSRLFRKVKGVCPSEFRKSSRS